LRNTRFEILHTTTLTTSMLDLLRCNVVWTYSYIHTNVSGEHTASILSPEDSPPCSALKIEAMHSSEKLVCTYKTTRHYNPEDQHSCKSR